jgi:hypothetical protein
VQLSASRHDIIHHHPDGEIPRRPDGQGSHLFEREKIMRKVERRGRPPSSRLRDPNGRTVRLTVQERDEVEKEQAKRAKLEAARRRQEDEQLIAGQPHRRGAPDDSRRESPLGRFVAANKLRPEIHRGVDAFGDLARRWGVHVGAQRDIRPPSGGVGGGEGPTAKQIDAWGTRIEKIRKAVKAELTKDHFLGIDEEGKQHTYRRTEDDALRTYEIVRAMVVDARDMMVLEPDLVIRAMCVIAVEMGAWGGKEHPFAKRAA